MNQDNIIRSAIEELYGPYPTEDFVRANEWANAIDWEDVKETVVAEHPDFQWTHQDPKDLEVAEAMIFDVRHQMMQAAGH
jgi:PIN domain nuclease of toxin-antitoxin system